MNVKETLLSITDREIRHRIFAIPDIPQKKLSNARSEFISRNEEVIVFVDNTAFGSGKGGLAITECHFYAKGLVGGPRSIRIDAINTLSYVSHKINLDIYINDQIFVTISQVRKADHEYLIMLLQLAHEAATYEAAATANVKSGTDFVQGQSAMQSCGACNADLPSEAQFCPKCGQGTAVSCGDCGNTLPADAAFCPSCGSKIEIKNSQLPDMKANIPNDIPRIQILPSGPQASTEEKSAWANNLYDELERLLTQVRCEAEFVGEGWWQGKLKINGLSSAQKYASVIGSVNVKVFCGDQQSLGEMYVDFSWRKKEIEIASFDIETGSSSLSDIQITVEVDLWAAEKIEIHEFTLDEGEMKPPVLVGFEPRGPVLRPVAEKFYAVRHDDGFEVWCENRAYYGNMMCCEIVSKPPENFSDLNWQESDDDENAGVGWLEGAEPGDIAYIIFGEAEKVFEGLRSERTVNCQVSAPTGTAEAIEGAFGERGDANEESPTTEMTPLSLDHPDIYENVSSVGSPNWDEIASRAITQFSKNLRETDDVHWSHQILDSEIAESLQEEGSEWIFPWEKELATDFVSELIEAIVKNAYKISEDDFIRLRAGIQLRLYETIDLHGEKIVNQWVSKLLSI